jgi:hypothetical protein
MPRFMLLIRGGNDAWQSYTPEQMQQALRRYFDWSDALRRDGRYVEADELKDGGAGVRWRDGQVVVDGPFVETKEGVGSFYLIEAADEAEAAEIAKGCPVIDHGGLVEVRKINQHDR